MSTGTRRPKLHLRGRVEGLFGEVNAGMVPKLWLYLSLLDTAVHHFIQLLNGGHVPTVY